MMCVRCRQKARMYRGWECFGYTVIERATDYWSLLYLDIMTPKLFFFLFSCDRKALLLRLLFYCI